MVSDLQHKPTLEYEQTPPTLQVREPSALSILARTLIGIWVVFWVIVFAVLLIGAAASVVVTFYTFDARYSVIAAAFLCVAAITFVSWYFGALVFRVISERFP